MLTKSDRRAARKALENTRRMRIANLRSLGALYDSAAAFARALGLEPTFLSQIAGPHPRRNIGEELARDLEARLKLPFGYLDAAH
jgi:hypothetical protein